MDTNNATFRKMRRIEKRGISNDEALELLRKGKRGVLAVAGDNDYPYAIPINFYFDESAMKIYFHSALAGHKVDSMKRNPKVCFTIFGEPEIRDLDWAPYVRSAVAFGTAKPVADETEKRRVLKTFAMKYYPNEAEADEEIAEDFAAVQMIEITIEHLTGKEIQEK